MKSSVQLLFIALGNAFLSGGLAYELATGARHGAGWGGVDGCLALVALGLILAALLEAD
jgi:hypothetical protein